MLSSRLGHVFDKPLERIAMKIPFAPNTLSFTGFLVTVIASSVLLRDLFWGGILVLAGGIFDILDGVVARVNNRSSRFGAFFDSVLDRYSDSFIFLSIAWYMGMHGNRTAMLLCLGTLIGALLISYTRARAEGIGEECNCGLMERPERIILVAIGTISGIMMPVLWLLFLLTHYTVLQRVLFVWRATHSRP